MNLIDLLQWIAILLLGFMYFNAKKKSSTEISFDIFPIVLGLWICKKMNISNSYLDEFIQMAEREGMFKRYLLDKE